MDYYFLDKASWEHSQGLYHAAAHLGREALFILRPATPYVCIGFHQNAREEIDLDFARQQGLPVFRREVGGGAVYLDSNQLFYQLVLRRDHPAVPANKADFYRKFLTPVAETYRELGIPATYRPVNDIVANGRKISGNGAAEIEGMVVLVGNFILDFDYKMMCKVLRVPDEKFRDKVHKTMHDNLTTIRREIGSTPPTDELAQALARRYEPLLGPLISKPLDAELAAYADQLIAEMTRPEWLLENDQRLASKRVKIAKGVAVIQKVAKTPGGLLRATAVNRHNHLSDVHLSGDFFFYPARRLSELEDALEGVSLQVEDITKAIQAFYDRHAVESPGITPQDFAQALTSG